MVRYATDGEYALMASLGYQETDTALQGQEVFNQHWRKWQDTGWETVPEALGAYRDCNTGYAGCAYVNHRIRQVIIAHRGIAEWGELKESYQDSFFAALTKQMRSALGYYRHVLTQFRDQGQTALITDTLEGYQLGFTGHALGAWLAEVCAADALLQFDLVCHTVTFESLGSLAMLQVMAQWKNNLKVRETLDITHYLTAPNFVNVCDLHVGRVIKLIVSTPIQNSLKTWFLYTLSQEAMRDVLEAFEVETGHIKPFKGVLVENWPHYNFSDSQHNNFQDLVDNATNFIPTADWGFPQLFEFTYQPQYRKALWKPEQQPLRHVHRNVSEFLECYLKAKDKFDGWLKGQGLRGLSNYQQLADYQIIGTKRCKLLKLEAPKIAVDWLADMMSMLATHPEYLVKLREIYQATVPPAIMQLVGANAQMSQVKIQDIQLRFAHLGANTRPEDLAFLNDQLDNYPIDSLRLVLVGENARLENTDMEGIQMTLIDHHASAPKTNSQDNPQLSSSVNTADNVTAISHQQHNVHPFLFGDNVNANYCTFKDIQIANTIYNYRDIPKEQSFAEREALRKKIHDQLSQFYQKQAAYIAPLAVDSDQNQQWPITRAGWQLMIATEASAQLVLYLIDVINEQALPDLVHFKPNAIIVTATGTAFFIKAGAWLVRNNQLVCLTGLMNILANKSLVFSSNQNGVLYTGIYAEIIIKAILLQYQATLSRDEQLNAYETHYQKLIKCQIDLEDLLPSIDDNTDQALQHVMVTGIAGIGKSTLLQCIAYRWSLDASMQNREYGIPLWQERYDLVFWLPLKWLHQPEYILDDKNISPNIQLAYFIQQACGLSKLSDSDDSEFLNHFAEILKRNKSRILLLMDSFNEVAHFLIDCNAQSRLLKTLLTWEGPVILTTRSDFKDQLSCNIWGRYRWVENQGFSDTNIRNFVQDYFSFYAHAPDGYHEQLLSLLERNTGMWGLAHIPLMAQLLCFYWQHSSKSDKKGIESMQIQFTLTELMEFFTEEFIDQAAHKMAQSQKIAMQEPSEERGKLFARCYEWLYLLGRLAFEGLRKGQSMILDSELQESVFMNQMTSRLSGKSGAWLFIPKKKTLHYQKAAALFKHVLTLGLLQPLRQQSGYALENPHTFLHLLFQEYLAAWYLGHELKNEEIQNFIRVNRYFPRYQYVLAFLAGLLSRENREAQQQEFWQILRQGPVTLDGLADLRIGLVCLTESVSRKSIKIYKKILLQESGHWLVWLRQSKNLRSSALYQYVKNQLIPVWQQLNPIDGQTIIRGWLKPLHEAVNMTQGECIEKTIDLIKLLRPLGPGILNWLSDSNRLIMEYIQQLGSADSVMCDGALKFLKVLRSNIVVQEKWVVAILEQGIVNATKDQVRAAITKLFQQMDTNKLLQYQQFQQKVALCLESSVIEMQQLGWKIVCHLGQKVLQNIVIKKAIEAAWWSWDFGLHRTITEVVGQWGYTMPALAALWYSLIEGIQSEAMSIQQAVIQILRHWKNTPVVVQIQKGISNALCSKKYSLKIAGLITLRGLGIDMLEDDHLMTMFLAHLGSSDRNIRCAALVTLGELGAAVLQHTELVAKLSAGLHFHNESTIQVAALQALGMLGEAALLYDSIPTKLSKSLQSQSEDVQCAAWGALAKLGNAVLKHRGLLSELRQQLVLKHRIVWPWTLKVVGQLGMDILEHTDFIAELQAGLVAKDHIAARCSALGALGDLKRISLDNPILMQALCVSLYDPDEYIQGAALGALGNLGAFALRSQDVMEGLAESLKSTKQYVKCAAFGALAKLIPEMLKQLQGIFGVNRELTSMDHYLASLAAINKRDMPSRLALFNGILHSLTECLEVLSPNIRRAALQVLGSCGPLVLTTPQFMMALSQGLKSEDEMLRSTALEVLSHIEVDIFANEKFRTAFLEGLKSEIKIVRAKALEVLASLRQQKVSYDNLVAEFGKGFIMAEINWQAACLPQSGDLMTRLCQEVKLKNNKIHSTVLEILACLGKHLLRHPELLEALRQGLDAQDKNIQRTAWNTLSQLSRSVLKDGRLLDRLHGGFGSKNKYSESAALQALGRLGEKLLKGDALIAKIRNGLDVKNKSVVQRAALIALGRLSKNSLQNHELLAATLHSALQSRSKKIRDAALEALSYFEYKALAKYPELVTALCQEAELPGESKMVLLRRRVAWNTLRRLGENAWQHDELQKIVFRGLKSNDHYIQALAVGFFLEFKRQDFGQWGIDFADKVRHLTNNLLSNNVQLVHQSVRLLVAVGRCSLEFKEVLQKFETVLQTWHIESIVIAALEFMGGIGAYIIKSPVMIAALHQYLNSENLEIRCTALRILGGLEPGVFHSPALQNPSSTTLLNPEELNRSANTDLEASEVDHNLDTKNPQQLLIYLNNHCVMGKNIQSGKLEQVLAAYCAMPGYLAALLHQLQKSVIPYPHPGLISVLLAPQKLISILQEYQQLQEGNSILGLKKPDYLQLIDWSLSKLAYPVVINEQKSTIVIYEETSYQEVLLDAKKIEALLFTHTLKSQSCFRSPYFSLKGRTTRDTKPSLKQDESNKSRLTSLSRQ